MNASKIFRRVLQLSLILAAAIAVVGGAIGYLLIGPNGLWSALIGTAMAAVFAALTVVSLIAAIRYDITVFFGIVMGAWLLKAVLFIVLLVSIRDASFVHAPSLFIALVAAVVGTLAIDVLVVTKGRIGYVSDPAPHDGDDDAKHTEKA